MKTEVAVLDANKEQRTALCRELQQQQWVTAGFGTFQELQNHVGISNCGTVIINLDNISVDNKRLKKLKMKRTPLHIIALSVEPFHPELEEAFREHISVCIENPVDLEELVYWLKTFDS